MSHSSHRLPVTPATHVAHAVAASYPGSHVQSHPVPAAFTATSTAFPEQCFAAVHFTHSPAPSLKYPSLHWSQSAPANCFGHVPQSAPRQFPLHVHSHTFCAASADAVPWLLQCTESVHGVHVG